MTRETIHPDLGPTPEQLAAFADGELPLQLRDEVQAWLADHPDAQAEVESHRAFLRVWRAYPPEAPSSAAWDRAFDHIAAAVSPGGGPKPAPRPRWRLRWPVRALGALVAAAAVLGGVMLARSLWGPEPGIVAPNNDQGLHFPAPKNEARDEEGSEPFPVVSAAEIHIISMDPRDADAVVLGQPRFLDTFVFASPNDIEVFGTEPHEADGPEPRLEGGSVPMVVPSPGWGREP